MALSRKEIIKDLRGRYPSPWGTGGGIARLEAMTLAKLRDLHVQLVALSVRDDMQRRPTSETEKRRQEARTRLTAAVARLKALKANEGTGSRRPHPAEFPVQGSFAHQTVIRHDTDFDALVHGMIDFDRKVDEHVFDLIATSFKENVAMQLKESVGPSTKGLDRLLDATRRMDLQAAIQTTFETSRLQYTHALQMRLFHEARNLPEDARLVRTLNHWVHETNRLSALEPLVLAAPDRVMPARLAPETLRKLQAFVVLFQPDAFYVADTGSRVLAEFLASEPLDVERPRAAIWQKSHATPAALHKQTPRILFISDVAEDAVNYGRFRKRVARTLGAQVGFAALVGSIDVRTSLLGLADTCIAALSFEKGYDLPWSRSGLYRRDKDAHVFGADSPKPLTIPDAFFDPPPLVESFGELEATERRS